MPKSPAPWTAGVLAGTNISVERLWRTIKYEGVYLNPYRDVPEAWAAIGKHLIFYNTERPH
jgi:putative transposase